MENPLAGLVVPEGWTTHAEIRDKGEFLQYIGTARSPEGKTHNVTATRLRGDLVYYDDEERVDADAWQQIRAQLSRKVMPNVPLEYPTD